MFFEIVRCHLIWLDHIELLNHIGFPSARHQQEEKFRFLQIEVEEKCGIFYNTEVCIFSLKWMWMANRPVFSLQGWNHSFPWILTDGTSTWNNELPQIDRIGNLEAVVWLLPLSSALTAEAWCSILMVCFFFFWHGHMMCPYQRDKGICLPLFPWVHTVLRWCEGAISEVETVFPH